VQRRPAAVELAGYLRSTVGAGDAARRYLAAFEAAGVPVRARDVPLPGRDAAQTRVGGGRIAAGRVSANVICLNPEQLLPYLDSDAAPRMRGRTTVAAWSWEVDALPPCWTAASQRAAEVWACSEFSAGLIRAGTGARVAAVLHPVATPTLGGIAPALPAGFRVLVIFDYLSTIQRKNPLGAIAAYRRAFDAGDGAQLIVKSVNGHHRPAERELVARAAAGRPDITLLDATLAGADRDALLAACDCLFSPHRSEGFGLSLADAMALGKPVIATAYGGNTEFMTQANSYLIPWERTLVGPGCEHYPESAHWAEPDLDAAAAALRAVASSPQEAAARGALAADDVAAQLNPARIGRLMAERLAALDSAT
jgi:glycosyltransferase involved in cell wall biosynthesis